MLDDTELFKTDKSRNIELNSPSNATDIYQLEHMVTDIIKEIGVPAHVKGYSYLRSAIMLTSRKPDLIYAMTKELYPADGDIYDTTSQRVERAIRHAIEVAWTRGDTETLNGIFGFTINQAKGKPTNSEFIAMISDRLRLQMKGA